jgi:hypothetical protein
MTERADSIIDMINKNQVEVSMKEQILGELGDAIFHCDDILSDQEIDLRTRREYYEKKMAYIKAKNKIQKSNPQNPVGQRKNKPTCHSGSKGNREG